MKAKLKTIKCIMLFMVVVLNIYLVYLNISINSYRKEKEVSSTANYVVINDKLGEEKSVDEEIVSEEKDEIKIVYNDMTLDELSEQIDKSLNSTISGKGYLIASYSIEKGVDPYMATAIMLHETGCKWECSNLVKKCNNVGGQKGSGCGSYSYFPTLDDGIKAFIDNLYKNYISIGLTTPDEINPKYAEDKNWYINVNKYIENIKAQ